MLFGVSPSRESATRPFSAALRRELVRTMVKVAGTGPEFPPSVDRLENNLLVISLEARNSTANCTCRIISTSTGNREWEINLRRGGGGGSLEPGSHDKAPKPSWEGPGGGRQGGVWVWVPRFNGVKPIFMTR